MRIINLLIVLGLLQGSVATAGTIQSGCMSRCGGGGGTVTAAVELADKGTYNLFVSVMFLRKPLEKMVYDSDDYKFMLDRLSVQWRGVALETILASGKMNITDLSALKDNVETRIRKLVAGEKEKIFPGRDVEVVFSLTGFYLMVPEED